MPIKNTTTFILGLVIGAISADTLLSPSGVTVTAAPRQYTQPTTGHDSIVPVEERIASCKRWYSCKQLAHAIVYEARGESLLGQAAVAHVILNRSQHPDFPDTIPSVIKQPKQFSFYGYEWKQKSPRKRDWDNAYSISYDVLTGTIEDVTLGSTFYATVETSTKRLGDVEYVMTIDRHKFYTARNSND